MKVNRDNFDWLQQILGYLRLKDLMISFQLVWKGTKRVGCAMVEKFPYKGKKGRYRKGKWVYISSVACWSLKAVFKKENGCSLSLQSTGKHIWKVQSERSCSKRWVFIVNGCKTSIPQGRWKWQAGINVTWGSMVRTSSLQPAGNGLRHICHILFYTRGNFIIHVFSCNKKGIEYFSVLLKR